MSLVRASFIEQFRDTIKRHIDSRRFEEAVRYCDAAISQDPNFEEAYLSRGKIRFDQKQYADAMEDFRRALLVKSEDPDTRVQGYLCRGKAYISQGLSDNAIDDFTAAIRINPKCWDAYYERGMAYYHAKGCLENARENFHQCNASLPPDKSQEIKRILGKSWSLLDRGLSSQQALFLKAKESEVKPDSPDVYCERAIELEKHGPANFDSVLASYHKALDLDPDCAKAWYGIGRMYDHQKKYQLAIENYSRAISKKSSLNPKECRELYFYCGTAHFYFANEQEDKNLPLMKHHLQQAREYFTQAILLNPDDQRAYYNRAKISDKLRSIMSDHSKAADLLGSTISDYSKAIDLEEKEVKGSTAAKNSASKELINLLQYCHTDIIFHVIKQIKDKSDRAHLLGKCLKETDPELGVRFFLNRGEIRSYLDDLVKEKIKALIDDLNQEGFALIFSDENRNCMSEESIEDEFIQFQVLYNSAEESLKTKADKRDMEKVTAPLEEWITDKKNFLAKKLSDGFLSTAADLITRMEPYMPPELLKINREAIRGLSSPEEKENCLSQLRSQLKDYEHSAKFEEKTLPEGAKELREAEARQTELRGNISAALTKLRRLEGNADLARAYEEANNAQISLYKINQQTMSLEQLKGENARLEKLDGEIRADLNRAIEKNSSAVFKKACDLLTTYTSKPSHKGSYAAEVDLKLSGLKVAKRDEIFLDHVSRISNSLVVEIFERDCSVLFGEINHLLKQRISSDEKTRDLETLEKYHTDCDALFIYFHQNILGFSVKEWEASCEAQINKLNRFCADQRNALAKQGEAVRAEAAAMIQVHQDIAAARAGSSTKKRPKQPAWSGRLFDPELPVPESKSSNGTELQKLPVANPLSKRPGE